MSFESPLDPDLRRYLLGEMAEDERLRLEEALFSDRDLGQRLLEAEDDLIDDHVEGRLGAPERQRFDAFFLVSTRRRRKLAFATALARAAGRARPVAAPRPAALAGTWRWAAVLAAAALTAALLLFRSAGPASRPVQRAAVPTTLPSPSPSAAATAPRAGARSDTVTLVLLAAGVRGGAEAPALRLRSDTQWAEIDAAVEGAATGRCRARIASISGREVWSQRQLLRRDAGGVHALLRVPATVLTADDYLLTLATDAPRSEELASYYIRVLR